jgi:hypothetical protein
MKYKNINSMLHNFGRSFCSLINYVDGEYMVDVVPKVLARIPDRLEINFPSGQIVPRVEIPDGLKKSIIFRSEWLPRHIQAHRIDYDKISEIKMEFRRSSALSRTSIYGFECDVCCLDDRGKHHRVRVNQHG